MNLQRSLALLALIGFAAAGCNNPSDDKDDDTGDAGDSGDAGDAGDAGDSGDSGIEFVSDPCTLSWFDCQTEAVFISASEQDPITENVRLTKDKNWVLSGGVFFGDDENLNVLAIDPGTTVYGEQASDGFLVIQRSAQIWAEGTASEPIVFTTDAEDGSRGRSSWGGLIINGRAPSNVCPATGDCDLPGEAGTGTFGGDDPADNSGILKYVRVEFAGTLINDQKEINGIAFQGVGSGTTVDYLHAHMCADDGMEFFGGTVNVKHVASTGVADDGIDWTDGFAGSIQYAFVQFHGDAGDNGFENDNNGDDNTAEPYSSPKVQNVTVIGGQAGANTPKSDFGALIREGARGQYNKFVILGMADASVALDQKPTYDGAWTTDDYNGNLEFTNSYLYSPDAAYDASDASCDFASMESPAPSYCPSNDDTIPFTAEEFVENADFSNVIGTDPMLEDPYNETAPNPLPKSGSPLLSSAGDDLPGMEATDYIGAFKDTNWLSWSAFPEN